MSKSKKRRWAAARRRRGQPLVPRPVKISRPLEFELATGLSYCGMQAVLFAFVVLMVLLTAGDIGMAAEPALSTATPSTANAAAVTADFEPFRGDALFSDGRVGRCRGSAARRRRARNKEEIDQEQRELLEKTRQEVADLVAEFHARLPRHQAKAIGALYARYSSRFQSSVPAQLRTLFEVAVREGTFIPADLVFYDLAVRGYRDSRPGLNALRDAISAKKFKSLLVFGTSRLYRKAHRAVRFVEEDLVEKGMRCFFVQQNIDTAANKDWRLHLSIQAAIDENGTSMYAENIRSVHQGMFLRMEVNGTLALGYCGELIPGLLTRRNRPKCKIAVDPETKTYVERIFTWYLVDGLAMDQIARLLNDDPDAPSPPKSLPGMWTHSSVRGVLANARYRGYWEYGKTYTCYQSAEDYLRQFQREAPLQAAHFEALRIVSDAVWYKVQALLLQERGNRGRKPTKSAAHLRPKLLNGILWCPEHDRPLQTGGGANKMMVCKLCRATVKEKRPLYTQLNRELALKLTLDKLAELVRSDEGLVAMIVEACRCEAATAQQPDPTRLGQLKSQEAKKSRAIQSNLRNRGDTEEDQAETDIVVAELRRERAVLHAEIGLLEAAQHRQAIVPEETTVRGMLADLGGTLAQAGLEADDTKTRMIRRLIVALTGGKIMLSQQGERQAQRGWLQGRFRVDLLSHAVERLTGFPTSAADSREVTIDFRRPTKRETEADEAWAMQEAGALHIDIVQQLKFSKRKVTALLKHASAVRGIPYEDGRSRRSRLERKHQVPPPFERLASEVGALAEVEGLLYVEIQDRLHVDKTTVSKAHDKYRADHGLPPLDGRARRKLLDHKNRPRPDEQS